LSFVRFFCGRASWEKKAQTNKHVNNFDTLQRLIIDQELGIQLQVRSLGKYLIRWMVIDEARLREAGDELLPGSPGSLCGLRLLRAGAIGCLVVLVASAVFRQRSAITLRALASVAQRIGAGRVGFWPAPDACLAPLRPA
jgi:hypothetical protein